MGLSRVAGARTRIPLSWVGTVFALVGGTARLTIRGQVSRPRTVEYLRAVGMDSAPWLVLIALPLCTLVIMGQGASSTSSHILSTAAIGLILHNIAPLIVTGVVLLRWPTSEAAHIALQSVSQGWTADDVEGDEVLRSAVAPAILGTAAGMVCLWSLHLLLIVVGGTIAMMVALGAPLIQLFVRIATSLSFLNLAAGLLFTALCGVVVAATALQAGLEARSLDDVPLAARRGLIRSLLAAATLGLAMTIAGGHWP